MEFYSRSNYPKTIPAPKCSKFKTTFSVEIDKETGKKEIKETGKTNIYAKIQKAKEATLIYNIIERYQNGDINAINKTQGTYGDFTKVPTSLAEAQQILINAEQTFNNLPLEERSKYNHNLSEFLAKIAKNEVKQPNYKEIIEQQQQEIEKLKNQNKENNE